MRIMQILPRMEQGGVERGVLDIARYFKHSEDEIVVVSGGGRLVKDLQALGVRHYRLNTYSKSLASLFSIPRLRRVIKKENIDIIHARSRVPAWISFFASRNTSADFITTAHGFYSVHFFSEIMGWGKNVICPSGVIARHMRDSFGVGEDKITIIPRWVDLDKFTFIPQSERDERLSLVSVGRISPSKGYEYLIKAMRKVVRANPYVRLSIIGDADRSKTKYLEYLKSLVHRYSLNYNIAFLGYRKDVEKILARARILILPSVVEESFGRVIIEAFACGVAVIASNVGAVPEIIENNKNGIVVPPKDSAALETAILNLLKNDVLIQDMTRRARADVEKRYTLDHCLKQTRDVYRQTKKVKRIMVIKISSFGDLILAVPALKVLKSSFAEAKITLLTLKKYASLFYDCPYVDDIIGLDDDYKKLHSLLAVSLTLRRKSFDYIVDLQNSKASHLLAFLSFPRRSFGYNRKFGFLLTQRVKIPRAAIGPLDSQENILSLMGVKFTDKKLLFWSTKEYQGVRLGLSCDQKYIGINVSASKKWSTKNWPFSSMKRFIDGLAKEWPEYTVILCGDKDGCRIAAELASESKAKIVNVCGKTTLKDLVGVLRYCRVFITQDTASLHLSCALGVETIALFGPTDPRRHVVPCENLHVIAKDIPCAACYRNQCARHDCMEKITPQEVLSKVREVI